jgi:threonine/homoserine efflux transporter RhtA
VREWLAIALVIAASAGATASVDERWKRSSPPAVD